jgi:non-specific serine/threonine protein kinase
MGQNGKEKALADAYRLCAPLLRIWLAWGMPTSAPSAHIDALPPGARLGEFEILELLGVGGFGMVYRGYDHSLQRAVAIKEYMPTALVARTPDLQLSARSSADQLPFESGLKSFIDEARVLARFDHPSLVKVYRFWEANHTAYMAMPLYQGVTLKDARSQMSGPPPEDWLRTVLWSVAQALKMLHAGNTLHRDVSPDNIFLQDQGPPVLLDLGSARRAITEHSHKHTAVLKVNYAPIEQYADAPNLKEGPWTDLYALAAVVHACICNTAPQPATSRLVDDRLPTLSQVAQTSQTHFGTGYGSRFCQAIDRTLALQPGDRPQDVDAFVQALELTAPTGMAPFNWRMALGPGVTLGAATSVAADKTQQMSAPAGAAQSRDLAATTSKAIGYRWRLVLAASAAVLGALALLGPGALRAPKPPEPVPIAAHNGATGSDTAASARSAALCANEPFYKRTWCVYQACQKPGMSKVPACVQERKRREDAAKTPQPY